eukprot:GDKJ01028555.1.p1 GENE.GDKJ01028555.1~~GDKJ01028555.1.p1  ORF type:complete len:629 (+),score=109.87 GDKJ01028555.1:146-1888(+)
MNKLRSIENGIGSSTHNCDPQWFNSSFNIGNARTAQVSLRHFINVLSEVKPEFKEEYFSKWIKETSSLPIHSTIEEHFLRAQIQANEFDFDTIGEAVSSTGLLEPHSAVEPLWETVRDALGGQIAAEFLSNKSHAKLSGITQFLAFLDFLSERFDEKIPFIESLNFVESALVDQMNPICNFERTAVLNDDDENVLRTFRIKNLNQGSGYLYLLTAQPQSFLTSLFGRPALEVSQAINLSTQDTLPNSHGFALVRGDFTMEDLVKNGVTLRYLNGLAHECGHALQYAFLTSKDQSHWGVTSPQTLGEYLTAMDALETPSTAMQYLITCHKSWNALPSSSSKKSNTPSISGLPSRNRILTAAHAMGILSAEVDRLLTRQNWVHPKFSANQIIPQAFKNTFPNIHCPPSLPLTHFGCYNRFNWYTGVFMAYPLAFVRASSFIKMAVTPGKEIHKDAFLQMFGKLNFRSDVLAGARDYPIEMHQKSLATTLRNVPPNSALARWRIQNHVKVHSDETEDAVVPDLSAAQQLVTPGWKKIINSPLKQVHNPTKQPTIPRTQTSNTSMNNQSAKSVPNPRKSGPILK